MRLLILHTHMDIYAFFLYWPYTGEKSSQTHSEEEKSLCSNYNLSKKGSVLSEVLQEFALNNEMRQEDKSLKFAQRQA